MEWEKQEEENGKEFWIVGDKNFDEELIQMYGLFWLMFL